MTNSNDENYFCCKGKATNVNFNQKGSYPFGEMTVIVIEGGKYPKTSKLHMLAYGGAGTQLVNEVSEGDLVACKGKIRSRDWSFEGKSGTKIWLSLNSFSVLEKAQPEVVVTSASTVDMEEDDDLPF